MQQRIAAIFAHPDDEMLACGGAMTWHAERGDELRIILLATGLTSRGVVAAGDIADLRGQAKKAAAVVGAAGIEFCDFPDNAMDTVPLLSVVQRIESFLRDFQPTRVYTHHAGDLNVDHGIVSRAVMTACRPLPGATVCDILTCEVNSSTEWAPEGMTSYRPTEFLDITGLCLERKLQALACYSNEMREWPHPRSLAAVRTLAQWRGSQVGLDAAEAYTVVRRIIR